jgi:hypothetical protein
MVKQNIKKILTHPCKIKHIVKKVANQTTIKPQTFETNIHENNSTNFSGTKIVEASKIV